jgi:ankyrin repeat protein
MRTIVALLASVALAKAGELHQAARLCDANRMRQLLSGHPSLNETDENGSTPLHIAIDSRQTTCVRLLLEAGADPNARDPQGRTALDVALKVPDLHDSKAVEDWRAIVVLLWKPRQEKPRGLVEPVGPMPCSLEYVVLHGQIGVMKMLLAQGADPNTVGKSGTTPLADAALKGDLDGVRLLLAHGARLDGNRLSNPS